MTVRSRIAMLAAEFLGTAVLATVAINISRSQIGIGYFVAIGVGLALGLLVLALGPTSGGHFNPAITIGMWTLRKIGTVQAFLYLIVQMLAGLAAWQLANYFIGSELQNIAGKSFSMKVFWAEMIGTFVFAFGVSAAVNRKYEGSKAAALVGGSLFMGVIVASLASNAILNPAIALANQSWGRAYIFGPIIGSVVGMNLFALLFADRETPTIAAGRPVTAIQPVRTGEDVVSSRSSSSSRTSTAKKAAPKATAAKRKTTAKKSTATRKRK